MISLPPLPTGQVLTKIMGGACAALILALVFVVLRADAISADRDRYKTLATTEASNHLQTKSNYAKAQADAAARQRALNAQIATIQQETSNAARIAHDRSLADIRARYERLLTRARARPQRSTDDLRVPQIPNASGQPDAASAHQGLPPARDALTQLERDLIATEQAHQLDALIDWINAQSKTPRN